MDAWESIGEVPRSLHEKAAQAHLLGIGYPEELGGSGGDLFHMVVLIEEILQGGGSSGLCAALLTHGIALPHILAAGDPWQIDRWVRPTLAGQMTPPEEGDKLSNNRMRRTRRAQATKSRR